MSKITLDNLSDNLKEYLNGLGLSEEEVNNIVNNALVSINEKNEEQDDAIEGLETKIGNLSTLNTTDKSNLVNALNEVFQNANSLKQIIADAIGDSSITSNSTFSAMSKFIQDMNTFISDYLVKRDERENRLNNLMVEAGYPVTGSEDLTGLIVILENEGI